MPALELADQPLGLGADRVGHALVEERTRGRVDERVDRRAIERAQAIQRASQSEGQRRMAALHGGRADDLEVSPNLWAGVGLVRGGAGTALVGSHDEVAERIAEYYALGIDEFILSGYPHLEEVYQAGEGLIPVLRRRGLMTSPHDDNCSPGG